MLKKGVSDLKQKFEAQNQKNFLVSFNLNSNQKPMEYDHLPYMDNTFRIAQRMKNAPELKLMNLKIPYK